MTALPTIAEIAGVIDHAILKPEFSRDQVDAELDIARNYSLFSVCVRPCDIGYSVQQLLGSGVRVGTVIGFPHGTTTSYAKQKELEKARAEGAVEFDMVLNIGWMKSGLYSEVEADIRDTLETAGDLVTKVIFETAYLTDDEIVTACKISEAAGAKFVKTSTGFAGGGATAAHLKLMRASVSEAVQVKASGGVRSLNTAIEYLGLGVTRLGTSSSATILDDLAARLAGHTGENQVDNTGY